ncbi:MAG: hypothetical protein LBS17_05205 [Actinomycetes bacterium]|nr:hypothetical protein [Actinomycetes bacterium]
MSKVKVTRMYCSDDWVRRPEGKAWQLVAHTTWEADSRDAALDRMRTELQATTGASDFAVEEYDFDGLFRKNWLAPDGDWNSYLVLKNGLATEGIYGLQTL